MTGCLIETNSPFLAPVPHRGKSCEPGFVADTARFLADLRGIAVEELGRTKHARISIGCLQRRRTLGLMDGDNDNASLIYGLIVVMLLLASLDGAAVADEAIC